ncbi:MAG: hypothetical protein HY22_09590 [[Candidatus Thermochlorobacteriaceae] bacterium GBChlB]|nr:MAG: hypothetical protein HY22_09590 [[Candidatus Thermochlorobacteriaceae] bacterium GBChlB]
MTVALVIYWAIGVICAIFFLGEELLQPKSRSKEDSWRRNLLFFFSLLIVLANTYIYYNATSNGGRPLDLVSIVVFSILNGACETFIFLAVFKLGEALMKNFTDKSPYLFMSGVLMFMVFSGAIHGLFWINALPPHVVSISDLPPDKVIFKQLFFPFQIALVLVWSAMYFFFRDVWSVVALHTIVDAGVVYSIHYSLFTNAKSFL